MVKLPDLEEALELLKKGDNHAAGLLLGTVAYWRAGDINSLLSQTSRRIQKVLKTSSIEVEDVIDVVEDQWLTYVKDLLKFTKKAELARKAKPLAFVNMQRAAKGLPPMSEEEYIGAIKAEVIAVGTPQPIDPTPIEYRLAYAVIGYQIGKDPAILAELVKGFGEVLKGIGEIVPL